MVEHLHQVLVVADLGRAVDLTAVAVAMWHLVQHALEEQVESRGGLDEVLEFLDDRVQLLWVLVNATDDATNPFPMGLVVCWRPFGRSRQSVHFLLLDSMGRARLRTGQGNALGRLDRKRPAGRRTKPPRRRDALSGIIDDRNESEIDPVRAVHRPQSEIFMSPILSAQSSSP